MTCWRRAPEVLWRWNGQRAIVTGSAAREAVILDGVAALVWRLLDEPVEEAELFGILADHFGQERVRVEADLRPFLEDLRDRGVLSEGAHAPA